MLDLAAPRDSNLPIRGFQALSRNPWVREITEKDDRARLWFPDRSLTTSRENPLKLADGLANPQQLVLNEIVRQHAPPQYLISTFQSLGNIFAVTFHAAIRLYINVVNLVKRHSSSGSTALEQF